MQVMVRPSLGKAMEEEVSGSSSDGESLSGSEVEESGSEEEEEGDSEGSDEDDEFEQQSSDDDSIASEDEVDSDMDEEEAGLDAEAERSLKEHENVGGGTREWLAGAGREAALAAAKRSGILSQQQYMHTDDMSSDDEDVTGLNTVGRVPLHWYDSFDHIGYDVAGSKIGKVAQGDRIDAALSNRDDPESKRTVYDMYNGRAVTLSERDLEIIRRIQGGAYAHPEFDDTPDYIDYESSKVEIMPIRAVPEKKANFQPSKYETMKVMKIIKAMEEGRYVSLKERAEKKRAENAGKPVYEIWNEAEDEILAESKRYKFHLPAPKMPLPGHAESYNPPEEFLLSAEEQEVQAKLDPTDRKYDFLPKKHSCLRHVGGYQNFIRERFERCLDLYLCPRQLKRRLNIDPETLLPQLPKPRDLKPFPNSLCLQYIGHQGPVRCVSVSQDGQYMVSGGEDGTVRLWEVDTCLCRRAWVLKEPITALAFNPVSENCVIAAASGKRVVLITPGIGDADATEVTETLLAATLENAVDAPGGDVQEEGEGGEKDDEGGDEESSGDLKSKKGKKGLGKWRKYRGNGEDVAEGSAAQDAGKQASTATWNDAPVGCRLELVLPSKVTYLKWHGKGDYLAVLAPDAGSQAVTVHQISRGASQAPFSKSPGQIQCFCFHPTRPYFFVATQQHVKVFHLVEQKLVKKLISGCKWISSIDVHSSGDHVVVGSYDRRLVWFDMDLSSKPYKTLKYHEKALRQVAFHRRFPLLASASDDGSVHVFHATVYNDLERNPMVVPLKVLRGHGVPKKSKLGVLATCFHPRQPWLFSAGADGVINLYQDL